MTPAPVLVAPSSPELDAHDVVADQPEIGGFLQCLRLDVGRDFWNFGERDDFAITDAAARFCMNDDARLRGELGQWYAPMPGDVIEEHGAHLRAKGAERRKVALHAEAVGREHDAKNGGIAGDLGDW